MYTKLTDMPNIGKTTALELEAAGIRTPDELISTGAKAAWLRLKVNDPGACINKLQGLEGAVRGVRRFSLSAEVKEDLKAFFEANR